jgi:hypothetical protein
MRTIVLRFILIQSLLGVCKAWASEATATVIGASPRISAEKAKVVEHPLAHPIATKKSKALKTRPVYRPRPQKVVAVNFAEEDESLEPKMVKPAKKTKAPEAKDNQDSFGTADDGKFERDIASMNAKSNVCSPIKSDTKVDSKDCHSENKSNANPNVKTSLKKFQRDAEKDLAKNYDQ